MPFDLSILCLKESKTTESFPFFSIFSFEIRPQQNSRTRNIDPYWTFLKNCRGRRYYLIPSDESLEPFLGCYNLCDIFYDNEKLKIEDSQYYDNKQHYTDLFQYIDFLPALGIKPQFRADFEKVVDYFLKRSPIKMIIFLPRFQGEEKDVIQGVFPRDEFFQMLDKRLVKFNMCYIIEE